MKKLTLQNLAVLVGAPLLILAMAAAYLSLSNSRPLTSASQRKDREELVPALSVPKTTFVDLAVLKNGRILATSFNDRESKDLYVSDNGGTSWRTVALPVGTVEGLSFVDETQGWSVGYGVVLKTEDGGENWLQLSKPTGYPLSEVNFINAKVGYAAGGAERGCQILRTSDGGKTWSTVYQNFEDGTVFDLEVLDQNTILAAVNDSFLLRSEDAGMTWKKIELEAHGASAFAVTPEAAVWVVGRRGSFYYSSDTGRTWQRPNSLPSTVLNTEWSSIAFLDGKRGIAVGKEGAIVVTWDGGLSWREVKTPVTDNLTTVRFNDAKGLVIGSHNIYKIAFPALQSKADKAHSSP